jgi:hypothetical protein
MPRAELDRSQFGGPSDIQDAWRLLAGGAVIAAQALIDVAENGTGSPKVAAAIAILKMDGLGADQVTFRVMPAEYDAAASTDDGRVDQAKIIRDRLDLIRQRSLAPIEDDEDEVVDAVIVEER